MSLPPAEKDIGSKPAAGSVVEPVNKGEKDADIDRKIRLFGVVQAFRQGRMPDNKQIEETLQYFLDHSIVDTSKLSPDGKHLINDTRDIVETARLIVEQKNADELFQNFVWHTRDVDYDKAKQDPHEVLPVDSKKAQDDGRLAVQHLRTILSLILTNSEVRKLLSDFSLIGRDLLALGASKVGEGLRPDCEDLARVNDSSPQDQFVTEGGRTVGSTETAVVEAPIPRTSTCVSQHPKDDLGKGAKVKQGNGEVKSGEQAFAEGSQEAQKGKFRGEDELNGHIDELQERVNGIQNGHEADAKKQNLMDKVRGMRDGITDRIPQQYKEKGHDHFDRGKHFLTEEYFPEERRDQFIFRGKKVIIECQKHDDYQESLRWLLSFLEKYVEHGQTIGNHGKESHTALTSDPALKQATAELRMLLERFANSQTIDPIIDAANVLIDDANRDPELEDWSKRVNIYIRKILLDAGFVIEPDSNNQGNALRESGRKFYDDKYKSHFDDLFSTVGNWFKAMGEDPLNKRFGEDWARLTRDLLFDSEGSLKFKADLWSDIRKVILPTLVDKVGYIPIPRIEYTDDSLDLVVENLMLSGRNLFPNVISLEAHNFLKFSPYNAITDEQHHEFTFTFSQMQADMRDVAFYFRKKTGIKMTDSGLADVVLGGSGLSATLHLVSADKDKSSVFKVKHVLVKVDSLKFSIRDSKHDFLYKTLKPLATGLVKRQIQKAIADAITTGMEYVDGQLVSVRDRMATAAAHEGESRMHVLHNMFKRKAEEASVKGSEKHSQFKVVSNKRNSVLSTSGHPAGWVNRTAEKEEQAVQGKEWRSEAFHIVPA
jgi:hypothetical protein